MATCLCDAFYEEAARGAVEVLEHLGCQVEFPDGQTCCGQPAFNAGDWQAARKVVRHMVQVFRGDKPVVIPSSSCAHMVLHSAPLAFEKEPDLAEIKELGGRTWELCDYIVNGLGVQEWPGRFPWRVAFHRSCHTRGSRSAEAAVQLLSSIEALEITEFGEVEQCCGFGGTFSVAYPNISTAMGKLKLEYVLAAQPDCLAAVDTACLMHLGGLAEKTPPPKPLRLLHVSQILREALVQAKSP